jgi:large subunit ribosomal protein L33
MAKSQNRELVTLICSDCKEENYRTSKNKKNTTDRLELKKYCCWLLFANQSFKVIVDF